MNGPTAHMIKGGEIVVIMGFELADQPTCNTLVDSKNKFSKCIE